MDRSLCFVLFGLILLTNVSFGYDLYQATNGDLLKGVLLGALLASQKHPNIVNYMPLPYYANYMTHPSHDNYMHNNQVMQEVEYKEQPTTHMSDHQEDSLSDQSETISEAVPTTSPITETTYSPTPKSTTAPSLDTLHQQLGLPANSVIVMLMPSHLDQGQQLVFNKEPEHMIGQNGQTIEQINSNYNLRTNAIKVGTRQLNSRGWKPVPIAVTTTPESEVRNPYNRPYIEKSQFGLRNNVNS